MKMRVAQKKLLPFLFFIVNCLLFFALEVSGAKYKKKNQQKKSHPSSKQKKHLKNTPSASKTKGEQKHEECAQNSGISHSTQNRETTAQTVVLQNQNVAESSQKLYLMKRDDLFQSGNLDFFTSGIVISQRPDDLPNMETIEISQKTCIQCDSIVLPGQIVSIINHSDGLKSFLKEKINLLPKNIIFHFYCVSVPKYNDADNFYSYHTFNAVFKEMPLSGQSYRGSEECMQNLSLLQSVEMNGCKKTSSSELESALINFESNKTHHGMFPCSTCAQSLQILGKLPKIFWPSDEYFSTSFKTKPLYNLSGTLAILFTFRMQKQQQLFFGHINWSLFHSNTSIGLIDNKGFLNLICPLLKTEDYPNLIENKLRFLSEVFKDAAKYLSVDKRTQFFQTYINKLCNLVHIFFRNPPEINQQEIVRIGTQISMTWENPTYTELIIKLWTRLPINLVCSIINNTSSEERLIRHYLKAIENSDFKCAIIKFMFEESTDERFEKLHADLQEELATIVSQLPHNFNFSRIAADGQTAKTKILRRAKSLKSGCGN